MNMKNLYIYLAVGTALLYAVSAPVLESSLGLFWILLGFIGVIAILFKNYTDLILIAFVGLNMYSHTLLYPNLDDFRHIAQTSAFVALTFLHITLLMGPLAKFHQRFAKLLKHRRHVGVAAFLMAFIHANFIIAKYYNFEFVDIYGINANFFGTTALIILSAMALTSLNYFQYTVTVKTYSVLHTGLLVFYITYTTFLSLIGYLRLEIWQLLIFALFVIFWILLAPWSLPKKLFLRVNGWKQLHYLVYIAYIAVIIHAWTGYFSVEKLPMKVTFWVPVFCVFIIHAFGWIRKIRGLRKLKDSLKGTPG